VPEAAIRAATILTALYTFCHYLKSVCPAQQLSDFKSESVFQGQITALSALTSRPVFAYGMRFETRLDFSRLQLSNTSTTKFFNIQKGVF
jgi:hypothetical protein